MKRVETKEVREYLIEYFREKESFRRQKAEEAPWDAWKNGGYAVSLCRMAEYVAQLPDDHPTLRKLADCPALCEESVDLWCIPSAPFGEVSFSNSGAIHCGPRGQPIEPAACADWFEE